MESRFFFFWMSLACLMLELKPPQYLCFLPVKSMACRVWDFRRDRRAAYECAYWPSKQLRYNAIVNSCFISVWVHTPVLCAHGVCPCVCSMQQRVEWQINRKQMNSDQYEAREWRREERLKVSEWGDAPERRSRKKRRRTGAGGGDGAGQGMMCCQKHSD